MDKTKDAIRGFMSRSGNHDTTVHETVNPAVQQETVKPTRHENVNTAVDKEVHQDHYHHTVQPIHDKEILPEQHSHNIGAVEHRDYDHRDHNKTKEHLATEAAKFKDQRTIHDTTHTQSHAPTVQGEHVHHHLHETIQPVVHKETIQPSVVHTTVPIHETHHNAAQHHSATTLPPVTMDEFNRKGGALGGNRKDRVDAFEGQPGSVHEMLTHSHREHGNPDASILKGAKHGCEPHLGSGSTSTTTTTGDRLRNETSRTSNTSSNYGTDAYGTDSNYTTTGGRTTGTGVSSSSSAPKTAAGVGTYDNTTSSSTTTSNTNTKPSLLNKINPMTDSNGDGQAGFMK